MEALNQEQLGKVLAFLHDHGATTESLGFLARSLATKGKAKGFLKRSAPPSASLERAAWEAATISANPFKTSVGTIMFFTDEQKAIYENLSQAFDKLPRSVAARFDYDRAALETLGVW